MTPPDPNRSINMALSAQQWNVVLAALQDAPWRVADPVIREITRQAEAPPAVPVDAEHIPARKGNGADHAAA